jgi:hypothetical protein
MIRRFNYTDRIRINRHDLQITLKDKNGVLWFDADLMKIENYSLPPESQVFVEAYRQTNWMRFSFGTIGNLVPPEERSLNPFNNSEAILFRVKVTSSGNIHKLLAEADRIPLLKPEETEEDLISLLPVKPQKLGDEIYRLDFSGDYPVLLINSDAGESRDIGYSSVFYSLVYPAVLREILMRVIVIDKYTDDSDMSDWRQQWVKFAKRLPGLGDLPEGDNHDDDRQIWVEDAVASFAKKLKLLSKFAEYWKKEDK